MPHQLSAILNAPPELMANIAPLMVVLILVIICGVGWLSWRNRKLRYERRHYTPAKNYDGSANSP